MSRTKKYIMDEYGMEAFDNIEKLTSAEEGNEL